MIGKSPSILITGGFGNLGSWLTEYFYSQGYDVTVLASRIRHLEGIDCKVIKADITNIGELRSCLTNKYDFCIHTASYNEFFEKGYAEKALNINSLGTRNLIEVLKDKKLKKFIYISTVHVYGNRYDLVDESCSPLPINDYAATHLFAEYYLKQFFQTDQFPSIICRLSNSYGAPKSANSTKWYLVLNDLVKTAYETGEIKLSSNGQASRDFIWMGDVCNILEKLLFCEREHVIYNLSSNMSYRIIELARIVKKEYETRYKKQVRISINNDDSNTYIKTKISNKKLIKDIPFVFSEKLKEEVICTFKLLEKSDE
jgi:UDP-glucose 4-epimerase